MARCAYPFAEWIAYEVADAYFNGDVEYLIGVHHAFGAMRYIHPCWIYTPTHSAHVLPLDEWEDLVATAVQVHDACGYIGIDLSRCPSKFITRPCIARGKWASSRTRDEKTGAYKDEYTDYAIKNIERTMSNERLLTGHTAAHRGIDAFFMKSVMSFFKH